MSQCNLAVRQLSVNCPPSSTDRTDEWVGRCMDSFHQSAISSQHSPASSNRNSTGSTSSSGCLVTQQHRLSGVSYESGHSHKSYCSNSSSSVGSLDRLEESGYSSAVNVHELFQSGLADAEILRTWLADLHFEEYYDLFVQAGYDMPTIAHMTPQDLSAIGISNPKHRKQLKQEINKLYIQDGFPDYKPADIGEWLHLLGLQEYYQCLQRECATIDDVLDIECEDLEEIGITKLGHQKKIQVAIERLKRIQSNRKRLSSLDCKPAQDMLAPPCYHGTKWLGVTPSGYRSDTCLQRSTSGDNLFTSSGPLELTTFQQPKEDEVTSQGSGGQRVEVMGKSWPSPNPKRVQRDQELVPIQLPRPAVVHHGGTCARPTNEPPPPYTFYDTREHNVINANVLPDHHIADDDEGTATIRRPSAKISPRVAPKPKPVAKIAAKTKQSVQEGLTDGIVLDSSNNVMERSYGSLAYSCSTLPRKPTKHGMSEHVPQPQSPVCGSFGAGDDSKQSAINGQETETLCGKAAGKKVPPPPPPKRTNSIKCNMNKVGQMSEGQHPASASDNQNSASVGAQSSPRTSDLPQPPVKPSYISSGPGISVRVGEKLPTESGNKAMNSGSAVANPPAASSQAISYSSATPSYMPTDIDGPLNSVIQQLEQQVSAAGLSGQHPAAAPTSQRKDGERPDWQHDAAYHEERTDPEHTSSVDNSASTASSDSSSGSGSIDTNTLPFANENVGTIKQRNPNNKTSIVTVGGGEEGDVSGAGTDGVDLNLSIFDDGTSTIRRNNNKPEGRHKVPPPISPKPSQPLLRSEQVDSDVLNDIDSMLQDLTDELDAMLDLEVT